MNWIKRLFSRKPKPVSYTNSNWHIQMVKSNKWTDHNIPPKWEGEAPTHYQRLTKEEFEAGIIEEVITPNSL